MGVLGYPRVHFRGTCSINPATGNNDDPDLNLDTAKVRLSPFLQSASDDEGRAWMTGGLMAINPINKNLFWYLRSSWNYFGDLTTEFLKVDVCSVVDEQGQYMTHDGLVGGAVKLLGTPNCFEGDRPTWPVICDVDPVGTYACQLFLGGFSLGDDKIGLDATHDTHAIGRWVMFRNTETYEGEQNFPGAGATWQFAIPKDKLTFRGTAASPVLAELEYAANEDLGIVVQFTTYQLEPKFSDLEMIARFQRGDYAKNPAEGILVGTIGVWNKDDLKTLPDGRWLYPRGLNDDTLAKVIGNSAYYLGPAAAFIQPKAHKVSLNLISTFPENKYLPDKLTKTDFGDVNLGYIPAAGGPPVAIGHPIDYDYANYELSGGIIDVHFDPTLRRRMDYDQGHFVLMTVPLPDDQPTILISEAWSEFTVRIDDSTAYLQKGGPAADLKVVVLERGQALSRNVTLYLWEFQYVTDGGGLLKRASWSPALVGAAPPLTHRLDFPRTIDVPVGTPMPLTVRVTGLEPGGALLAFTTNRVPPAPPAPLRTAYYAGFRVMPVDDYSDRVKYPDALRCSWKFIYEEIFKYYYLVFPAMSKHIPFNNQAAMEAHACKLAKRTDPALFEGTLYMPHSRDLSDGKRQLLIEWAEWLNGGPCP